MREIARAKVYRELLAEDVRERRRGTCRYHLSSACLPAKQPANAIQFAWWKAFPSFLDLVCARSAPRRHSLTTKFHQDARVRLSFCPLFEHPRRYLFSSACPFTLALPDTGRLFPLALWLPDSWRILHFFSRVMRFRVFALIWIPPNALLGKCLVARQEDREQKLVSESFDNVIVHVRK